MTDTKTYEPFKRSLEFKNKNVRISVDITFSDEGRLSLNGNVYESNKYGWFVNTSAGQVQDQLIADFPKNKRAVRLYQIWERWHLNDMHAGCEHQRASWNQSDRTVGKPCEVCGYKYGSDWLFEEVPQSILDELKAL